MQMMQYGGQHSSGMNQRKQSHYVGSVAKNTSQLLGAMSGRNDVGQSHFKSGNI